MGQMNLGRFRVARELIDDGFGLTIFEGMVPVKVECLYATGGIEVTACSEYFGPVPRGQEPPLYRLEMVGEKIDEWRLGNWRRVLTRIEPATEPEREPEPYGEPAGPLDFRLKVYPNPMRDDGVFVAEDKEITPYPGVARCDGKPCYPAVPTTRYSLGHQLDPEFGAELVRRWNLAAPKRGFGERE